MNKERESRTNSPKEVFKKVLFGTAGFLLGMLGGIFIYDMGARIAHTATNKARSY